MTKANPAPKIGKPGGAKKMADAMTKLRKEVKENAKKVAEEMNSSNTIVKK